MLSFGIPAFSKASYTHSSKIRPCGSWISCQFEFKTPRRKKNVIIQMKLHLLHSSWKMTRRNWPRRRWENSHGWHELNPSVIHLDGKIPPSWIDRLGTLCSRLLSLPGGSRNHPTRLHHPASGMTCPRWPKASARGLFQTPSYYSTKISALIRGCCGYAGSQRVAEAVLYPWYGSVGRVSRLVVILNVVDCI